MDLSTTYMGMKLKHPVVASASPLSHTVDGIRKLEDGGAAAVVMYSLFEEQIEGESHLLDHYLNYGTETFAEALHYFPNLDGYNIGPEQYLNLIRQAKVEQIYSVMQTAGKRGMQTLEQALAELVMRGIVTQDVALNKSSRPDQLFGLLERSGMAAPPTQIGSLRAAGS